VQIDNHTWANTRNANRSYQVCRHVLTSLAKRSHIILRCSAPQPLETAW